ncbi:MAG: hypothetical protein ACRDKI_10605 [Solirubrobacterales bacterium]
MNKNTRWALAIVGVVILIVAALVISSGGDDTDATVKGGGDATQSTAKPSGSTGATSGGSDDGGSTGDTGGAKPEDDNNGTGGAKPQDDNSTGGAKVGTEQGPLLRAGKVAKISVKQGDTVYVRARSATENELHIHGYDYKVDLPAGKTVSYKFKADISGVFVMEFENQGLQVAELKVNP